MLGRFTKVCIGFVFLAGLFMVFGGVDILIASATEKSLPEETITICHATGSPSKPYVPLDVKVGSNGRVQDPQGITSDDVVPPYSYAGVDHAGTNWTAAGQALWYRGCQPPTEGAAGGSLQPAGALSGAGGPTPSTVMPSGETPNNPVLGVYLVLVGLLTVIASSLGWMRITV
jgi:hypothetical protein